MNQFDDGEESYNIKGEGLTFREIVMRQLKRITELASREMRGGYWLRKPHPNIQINTTIDVYVPDSREEYSNAIDCLSDMLLPYFDEEMIKAEDDNIKIMEDLEKECDWKNKEEIEGFREKRWRKKRNLLRELSKFMKREGYLQAGVIEE